MPDSHDTSDDLEARLEEDLGPVEPPPGLRGRVLGAPRPLAPRRLFAVAAPLVAYALGVLTVLVLPRESAPPPADAPTTGVSFRSIADQPPRPAPETPALPPEPVADEPLPRIS
jgi:hypothetical protein